jgi:2-methylisocitrate lyase-like PEP mutase family enzyme
VKSILNNRQGTVMNQVQRGLRFQQLHTADSIFLMPNAWDVGSALMLASCGFPAIATTSAGVAFSLGLPDQEAAVNRETMLDRVGSIAAASPLPVSADLQSGYGEGLDEVGETITAAIRAGVVGANIEDYCGHPGQALFDREHAVSRVRAARRAADASGVPFVLTARTDAFLTGASHPFAEAVERCNAYREAGADCLFVPGASDPKTIEALVREINGPITVVMGLTGSPLNVSQLGSLGVRRVTIGGSLARATFGLIRRAAQEMAMSGTFSYADQQIPDAELSKFFADQRGSGFAM